MGLAFVAIAIALIADALVNSDEREYADRTPDGKQVITFYRGAVLGRWDEPVYHRIVEQYNQSQDHTHVRMVYIPYTMYIGKLNLAVTTGNPPDVCLNVGFVANLTRQNPDMPDLTVPIPDDMLPPETRQQYGEGVMSAISVDGKPRIFPRSKYMTGGAFVGNHKWFEKAGIDLRDPLENGWDYDAFCDAMKRIQAVMREEIGPDAHAFGVNLLNLNKIIWSDLMPPVIGKDAASRAYLLFDEQQDRYVLDPAVTVDHLAQPLTLLHQLVHVDRTWGTRNLGLEYGQLIDEMNEKELVAVIMSTTAGSAVGMSVEHMEQYKQGLKSKPVLLTMVPVPTPRQDMLRVSSLGAGGWGALQQIQYKGDDHARAALEFAQYLASPEVLTEFYRTNPMRYNPWPDEAAVKALAPEVEDPIDSAPWLNYQWRTYLNWMQTWQLYSENGANEQMPHPAAEAKLRTLILQSRMYGRINQIVESMLYDETITPRQAAEKIHAELKDIIDDYYKYDS